MSQSKEEGSALSSASEIHGADDDDLVSKLPAKEGWPEPLVLYSNYWLRPHLAAATLCVQRTFKPRRDDTILVTNPKCGTTWLKALAFTITTRHRYELAGASHPLLSRHPQDAVPYLEISLDRSPTHVESLETIPSPRLLATHLPASLLPERIASWGCRVVYMCRDPKDAFVSRWHFENRMRGARRHGDNGVSLDAAFSLFLQGVSAYGPFWDHCLEYWSESVASPEKVLFLRYEDVMAEPVEHVVRLAAFLGAPFSAEEEEDGVPEQVVRLCCFDRLSGLHGNQTGDSGRRGKLVLDRSSFFRKGKVGDWVNHMSEEMGREMDRVVEEKLCGSGLVL